jgi:hypothetical protein
VFVRGVLLLPPPRPPRPPLLLPRKLFLCCWKPFGFALEYPAWPPARCWLDPALLAAAAVAGALLWGGKDFSISLCHLALACTLFLFIIFLFEPIFIQLSY